MPLDVWRATVGAIEAGHGRACGPVAAALRSLAQLGLGSDIECWSGVPAAPHGWRPAERPLAASQSVLLEAWHRAQWAVLAARRGDFAHVGDGVDSMGNAALAGERPARSRRGRGPPRRLVRQRRY
jgi:hypothetical protein